MSNRHSERNEPVDKNGLKDKANAAINTGCIGFMYQNGEKEIFLNWMQFIRS